jgi:hypothetical protein
MYPEVSFFDLFEKPGRLSASVIYKKSRAWEQEKEWRVILTKGDIKHELPGEVIGILFGLLTPEDHKREVAEAALGHDGIILRQAVKVQGKFRIDFIEYRQ